MFLLEGYALYQDCLLGRVFRNLLHLSKSHSYAKRVGHRHPRPVAAVAAGMVAARAGQVAVLALRWWVVEVDSRAAAEDNRPVEGSRLAMDIVGLRAAGAAA